MARTPRARVHKTSGQGVSRLSYQKGYALRHGDGPRVDAKFTQGEQQRSYSKGKAKGEYPSGINVSYGDTYFPTDLADITTVGEERPPKGWKLEHGRAKRLK